MSRRQLKIIEICGVGKIRLEKSAHAKRLCLTVRPFKEPRVAVPLSVSFHTAAQFALSKGDWLKKQNVRMADREQKAMALYHRVPIQRSLARRRIVDRLEDLASRTGLCYQKVSVRNQKARWGSCSQQNNISLNINLVRLPEALMDYVILHELVHTRIKNHGAAFWKTLSDHAPQAKVMDRALRQYSALLCIPLEGTSINI